MPEMYMTEGEICYRYRINGCYGEKYISILAQLNACTCKNIFTQAGGASLTPLQIQGYARKGVTDA